MSTTKHKSASMKVLKTFAKESLLQRNIEQKTATFQNKINKIGFQSAFYCLGINKVFPFSGTSGTTWKFSAKDGPYFISTYVIFSSIVLVISREHCFNTLFISATAKLKIIKAPHNKLICEHSSVRYHPSARNTPRVPDSLLFLYRKYCKHLISFVRNNNKMSTQFPKCNVINLVGSKIVDIFIVCL